MLVAISIAAAAGNCGAWYAIPRLCMSLKVGYAAAAAVGALPLLVIVSWGRMLPALLGLYIVLVPIDDALLVYGGLTVTKIVGLAIALAAAVELIRKRPRIAVPYAVLGWVALVALMAMSLSWSINPEESIGNVVTIASALALLVIVVVTPMEASDLRIVVLATILSGAAIGVVAIAQRHDISEIAGQVGRIYLSFGTATLDPNRFGASLLLPIAMATGAFFQVRGWWVRAGLLCVLGMAFTAVYLSASRGTLVALGVMAVIAILGSKRRVLLGSLLAAAAALVLIIPSELSQRIQEGTAQSGTGRTDIWKVGIAAIPSHWLLGTGQGTFHTAYNRAFFLTHQSVFLEWGRDPHNLIVSTIVELGVVGVLFLAVALILQYRSVRLIPADDPFAWLRPVLRASLIGLIVAAMFVDVLATKFAWVLLMEMLLFAAFAARSSLPGRAPVPSIVAR
ncbi:MAG TPA: O-antigen ligase family protein, partial [Candidatus Cybelea sp.]|jgi:O-antigen ligase